MRKVVILMLCGAVALGGCSSIRKSLGAGKKAPDEFAVVTHKPLVVPPEYGIKPPRPGEKRPQEFDSTAQAISALFPGRTTIPQKSAGERALLSEMGADQFAGEVRSNVGNDASIVADKGVFLREILSTQDGVVDHTATAIDHVASEPLTPPQ